MRVACMDVACEQVFFLLFGGGGVARSHVKEDASLRGGEREEEFSSAHRIDLRNLF